MELWQHIMIASWLHSALQLAVDHFSVRNTATHHECHLISLCFTLSVHDHTECYDFYEHPICFGFGLRILSLLRHPWLLFLLQRRQPCRLWRTPRGSACPLLKVSRPKLPGSPQHCHIFSQCKSSTCSSSITITRICFHSFSPAFAQLWPTLLHVSNVSVK